MMGFRMSVIFISSLVFGFSSLNVAAITEVESRGSLEKNQEVMADSMSRLQVRIDELKGMDDKVNRIQELLLEQSDQISVLKYKSSLSSTKIRKISSTNNNIVEDFSLQKKEVAARIDRLSNNSSTLDSKLTTIENDLDKASKDIETSKGDLEQIGGEVASSTANVIEKIDGVNNDLAIRTLFITLCIFILVASLVVFRRRFNIDNIAMSGKITQAREELDGEYNSLDLKLSEMLSKQIEIEALAASNSSKVDVDEVDHSLPLKVATEIHRMSKRIASMADDTKGIKPLMKALERLQETLFTQNYEIINLLGNNYVDGMVVNQEIIVDDSFSVGEQVITKVVKPQVNHNDKIIQVADVIVSIGE
jgi:chromosome segregation ATPase